MYYAEVPGVRVCAYDAADAFCDDPAHAVGAGSEVVEQCHVLDLYDYWLEFGKSHPKLSNDRVKTLADAVPSFVHYTCWYRDRTALQALQM